MTEQTILLILIIILLCISFGIRIYLVIKNKQLNKQKQYQLLLQIATEALTQALKLGTLKTAEQLEDYCVELTYQQLQNYNIKNISKDEVRILIKNMIIPLKELFNKPKNQKAAN